jgi:hypothetical protein
MQINCKLYLFIDFDVLTINSDYKTEKLLELDSQPKGLLHVSILAHDSAQIVFTHDEEFKSGYVVVLGGWANTTYSMSIKRYCPRITQHTYTQDCTNYAEKVINSYVKMSTTSQMDLHNNLTGL